MSKRNWIIIGIVLAVGIAAFAGLRMFGVPFRVGAVWQPTSLSMTKTAQAGLYREIEWTIDKSVTPETWDLFKGDSGTSQYTVSVTKTVEENYLVTGEICVTNTGDWPTQNLKIIDRVQYKLPGPGDWQYTGETFVFTPEAIPAGETVCYPYEVEFEPIPGASYRNEAKACITNHPDDYGNEWCTQIRESFTVSEGDPIRSGSEEVDVHDSNGGSWHFTDSDSVTYEVTFDCNDDEGTHTNIATMEQTGQDASAEVTVNCHELDVEKTANTSFKRKHNWDINKTGSHTNLTLSDGQQFLVTYEVSVNTTGYTDSSWEVSGDIEVHNTAPIDATINSIADVVSPAIAAGVSCGVAFPYTLSAGGNLSCTYSASLPDGSSRTNEATAVLQNYDYDHLKSAISNGTTDFTATAPVTFDGPSEVIDECVDVNDSYGGVLGTTICTDETFTYDRWIGSEECGVFKVTNIATFETNDTSTTGDDTWEVDVTVTCPGEGCTLTWGYWRNHSNCAQSRKHPGKGAPRDETWDLLPGGLAEDTIFFPPKNGQTYCEVLDTPPKGNAYYQLARQYIAAQLNILNGADPAAVAGAIANAESLFATWTPAQIAKKKGNNPTRKQFINLAGTLASYNEGDLGPEHCDEQ
jgi:hypothetical protein